MMLGDELPEHVRLRLLASRQEYLDTLRGPSATYDLVRRLTKELARATGAKAHILELIEASLLKMAQGVASEHAQELERVRDSARSHALEEARATLKNLK
jgi:hypothetical protein